MRPTASLLLSLLVVMSAESRPLSKRPAQLHELKGRQLHVRAATKSLEMVAANTGQRARRSGGRKQVVGRVLQYLVRVQHPAPPALPGFLKEVSEGGFLRYLPHDTYVLALDSAALQKVVAADGVVEAFELPPSMKIEPDILTLIAAKVSTAAPGKNIYVQYTYIHIYMYCIHYMYIYVCVCVSTDRYICTHTHTHTHTHTLLLHTHRHTPRFSVHHGRWRTTLHYAYGAGATQAPRRVADLRTHPRCCPGRWQAPEPRAQRGDDQVC
jgi:hypothetical protein